jgi:hypothetical protein
MTFFMGIQQYIVDIFVTNKTKSCLPGFVNFISTCLQQLSVTFGFISNKDVNNVLLYTHKESHGHIYSFQLSREKKEKIVDTKWVIRNRKSKKDKLHNGQEKKDKRTNNDLQNIHIRLKIE